MKQLLIVAALLPLLAACGEDRNGPGSAGSRRGYDVHADEYRHAQDPDHDQYDTYHNDHEPQDRNCPWKGQC